jgi:hypothetical protein
MTGRDSVVGVAIAYGVAGRGLEVRVPVGERFFPPHFAQTGFRAHPAS